METDKQIYEVFQAVPEWLYLLLGEPAPSGCRFESITVKAIERRIDGVCDSSDAALPLMVAEFQGYKDDDIYLRVVQEMALLQQQRHRSVRGVILYLKEELDPKTEPWRRVVQTIYLNKVIRKLRRQSPTHPLVALFEPLFAESEERLEKVAASCYHHLCSGELDARTASTLQNVFVNWLMQRLRHLGTKEIEAMISLSDLPDLSETKAGKELIEKGMEKGALAGIIREYESLMGLDPSNEESLRSQSNKQLQQRLTALRSQFAKRQRTKSSVRQRGSKD
jgi:predicted transposase YdaD